MFCRQLEALLRKNFTIKTRLWKQTVWELILPLLCGIIAGVLAADPYATSKTDPIQQFQDISVIYLISITLITISFSGACTFILNQVVVDKETKMLETLKIMSMSRSAYTFSYFISQGLFVILTGTIVSLGFIFSYGNPMGDSAPVSVLFLGTILFGLALMSLSMVLSTIFTDSKLSAQVGMFIILLPTSVFLFCITNRLQTVTLGNQGTGY